MKGVYVMKCAICGRGKEFGPIHRFRGEDGVLIRAHTGCYVEDSKPVDENEWNDGIYALDVVDYPKLEMVIKVDDDFGHVLVREDTGVNGAWASGQEYFTFDNLLTKYNELVEAINDTLSEGSGSGSNT